MKCAIYARVSTDEQSVEMQLTQLRQYAGNRGWSIAGEYTDEGVSGAAAVRPALSRLVVAAKRREFDVLLVWKLDRLGRSLTHLLATLSDFEAWGIQLACYQQPIDTTTPSGRLMFQIIGAFAEFEREMIRERVRAGMANARRKGGELGRPRRVFRVDQAAVSVQAIGLRATARKLGIPASTILRRIRALQKDLPAAR